MEVDANRQRDFDRRYSPTKDIFTKGYTSAPNMSTAAVMNPVSLFSSSKPHIPNGPPPPYRASAPAQGPPQALSGLISPPTSHSTESRRTSDDVKEQTRLPSIAEAIGQSTEPRSSFSNYSSAPPPPQSYAPAYGPSASTPTSQRFPPHEPSPYSAHYEPPSSRRNSPPQPLHPTSAPYPREPPQTSFPEARQPQLRTALPTQSPQHPDLYPRDSPYARHEQDGRAFERADPPPRGYGPPQRDGRYEGYPTAPMHNGPYRTTNRMGPEEFEPKRPPVGYSGGPYETTLKRNLDVWEVEQNLEAIHHLSNKVAMTSHEALLQAQRYGRTPHMEGSPSLQACESMIAENEQAHASLIMLRNALLEQERHMAEQQQRRESGKEPYSREDVDNWGGDQREMGMGERNGNKRRGQRAAPPGRCHSCNRAETPEWRRGPDGARTLCNACGLHYAKLTRKSQMQGKNPQQQGVQQQGSNLRPKSMDES